MNRSLENFESWITKSILSKGENYWVNDNVQNLEQDRDTWEADVYGTDDYVTGVTVKNGQVEEWFCDCPYDHGPICKHVVAVMFAVRDEIPDELLTTTEVATSVSDKIESTKQKKKPANPIEEIIEKLTEPELRKLITYFVLYVARSCMHLILRFSRPRSAALSLISAHYSLHRSL